ncbi:MAG: GTPase RsgA [Bacilli bacterium]|jgi:ribosome biogenesis GTPase A|nr:GTPase RsgA [Bacilli bacterium]
MIKKCIGCGTVLEYENKEASGYTPNIKNDYCMRCFRLKNYGEIKPNETVDEERILTKVNKSRGLVFFLIDYLNLNKYTLDIFKKITLRKVLVISKSDILRRDMKFSKIKSWLNQVYDINEDIIFMSNKNNYYNLNIFKTLTKYNIKTCYVMGITNSGKSTFINSILKKNNINKEIVTSNKPNTTLDFIKIRIDDYIIYDTPGFNYSNVNYKLLNNEIKPITFNITKETTIIINNNFEFFFTEPNSITIYTTDNSVKRIYKNNKKLTLPIIVPNNSDLIIPGIGFINVKNTCQVLSNIEIPEIRPNISGENYG